VVPRGGQPPVTDRRSDRLARLVTHPRQEAHKELPSVVLGPSGPKRVAQEVELDVLVLALPVAILAVDDPGLLRMKLQTAFRQSRPDRLQQLLCLSLTLGVDDHIICITLERDARVIPLHPVVEGMMQKEVSQQR